MILLVGLQKNTDTIICALGLANHLFCGKYFDFVKHTTREAEGTKQRDRLPTRWKSFYLLKFISPSFLPIRSLPLLSAIFLSSASANLSSNKNALKLRSSVQIEENLKNIQAWHLEINECQQIHYICSWDY